NDATPTLSINDVTVAEGGTATFTVTLSAPSGLDVSFDWASANSTAVAGQDYTAANGVGVTIPAGSVTTTVAVTTSDDSLDELSEIFHVNLSNSTNATIADSQGVGTITDNDSVPSLSISDVTVIE